VLSLGWFIAILCLSLPHHKGEGATRSGFLWGKVRASEAPPDSSLVLSQWLAA
jgi:hypothetical protein